MSRFFELERTKVGWRFWLLWVLATNVGFFGGLWLGSRLVSMVGPDPATTAGKVADATIGAAMIGLLTGATQAATLARHGIKWVGWTVATAVGWTVGIATAGLILFTINPDLVDSQFVGWIVPSALIAGAVVGVAQAAVLRRGSIEMAWKWVPIGIFGWGIQFPGMLPGVFLARWLTPPPPTSHNDASPNP